MKVRDRDKDGNRIRVETDVAMRREVWWEEEEEEGDKVGADGEGGRRNSRLWLKQRIP
jgi:hypothetical protein